MRKIKWLSQRLRRYGLRAPLKPTSVKLDPPFRRAMQRDIQDLKRVTPNMSMSMYLESLALHARPELRKLHQEELKSEASGSQTEE